MAYTFLQLQDEVLAYGFNESSYRARVKNWLNEGQRRVSRFLDLPGLETTTTPTLVVGTNSYTLPTDVQRVESVYDNLLNYEERLLPIEKSEFEELLSGISMTGHPDRYAVDGLVGTGYQIHLWPAPDLTSYQITVRYVKLPAAMAADADVPALAAFGGTFDYEDLIISYACYKAYGAEDDAEQAGWHYSNYDREIRRAKADLGHMVNDSPKVVPGTWGGFY